MNRREHLLVTAARVSRWGHHSEHLVLDWSSRIPLKRADLPSDPRLRLVRVDGEREWHLCRAYNLALKLAEGVVLFKLDADCWLEPELDPQTLQREGAFCSFGSGPDGRLGQWILDRSLFETVGGFNELLTGYGFDDKDLRARVMAVRGGEGPPLPQQFVGVIPHSALERMGENPARRFTPFKDAVAQAQNRACATANRVLAASAPWTAQRSGSRYLWQDTSASWLVDVESVQRPPMDVDDEARRLRRSIFWGELLALPAPLVRQMPRRLLPEDRRGRIPVGRLHQLTWYLLRPVWSWPVVLLRGLQQVWGRTDPNADCDERFRTAYRSGHVAGMLAVLEQMPSHRRKDLVDRLLFQRAHRPVELVVQIALLERLQQSEILLQHQRAYAGIALGWTLLRCGEPSVSSRCRPVLEADVSALLADPETRSCSQRNRENRLKRLISCWNLLSHLALQEGDAAALLDLSSRSSSLLSSLDPESVPGDVLLRVSSNWARTLLWQAPAQPDRLVDDLNQLLVIIESERCSESRPEEDHRAFVRQWLHQAAAWHSMPSADLEQASSPLVQALTVHTPVLEQRCQRFWKDVLIML